MARRKSSNGDAGWVYSVDAGEIGAHPYRQAIAAGEADLKAIAARLEIPAVHSLSADITLQRIPGNKAVIHAEGILKASVTQSCVITGAPVKAYVEEEFEGWYADPASFTPIARARQERASKAGDIETPILEEHEDPEPIINGKIDLGDLTAQYLSLSLDPYPKVPGAVRKEGEGPEEPSPLRKNPFAVLKDWKGGD
jgi:hypothetical protein